MKLFKHILFFILFDYIFLASISPYINYKFNSNSELYAINDQDLNYLSFGLNLKHTSNNINFNSNFSYHLYSGINKRPNNFNSKQGFGYLENNPGFRISFLYIDFIKALDGCFK